MQFNLLLAFEYALPHLYIDESKSNRRGCTGVNLKRSFNFIIAVYFLLAAYTHEFIFSLSSEYAFSPPSCTTPGIKSTHPLLPRWQRVSKTVINLWWTIFSKGTFAPPPLHTPLAPFSILFFFLTVWPNFLSKYAVSGSFGATFLTSGLPFFTILRIFHFFIGNRQPCL